MCSKGGTSSSAYVAGGSQPSRVATTEEWTAPSSFRQINLGDIYYNADPSSGVIKYTGYGTGAWSSGGNLNTARGFSSAFGTQTAAIFASGYTNTNVSNVENYNGSSWSEVAEVNTPRRELMGFGTATAGLKIGGRPPQSALVESWNGSAWTETGDLNTARSDGQSAWGTLTSVIVATAFIGSTAVANVESWNGSAWTETTDVNTARNYAFGLGTSSSDGVISGGDPNRNVVEQYDGSSWTEVSEINTGRQHGSSSGSATSGIIFAGYHPNGLSVTESWNGSSWTEVADLSTSRYGLGGSTNGTSALGLGFGGFPGPIGNNATEEWTVPESNLTLASTTA